MIGDDYAYQLKEMPGIDERLSRIIAKMIAREEERYGSIKEVIQDMTAYLTSVRKLPESRTFTPQASAVLLISSFIIWLHSSPMPGGA